MKKTIFKNKALSIIIITIIFTLTLSTRSFMQNTSSGDVTNLQNFLIDKGYLSSKINGTFDNNTENAIKAFQKDQGLDPTGEVDDMTQTAMISSEAQSKPVTGKSAQAAWISIANAGYGGPLTKAALADPSNSPSGIQASMQTEINKQVADAQFAATNKYNANGGIIGNEKCLDKDGKIKKIDPTDPTSAYCDNISTSGSDSAAKVKADIEAARQSPYLSMVATAQNTENKSKSCSKKDTLCKINNTAGKIGKYASILNSILSIGVSNKNEQNTQYSQLSNSIGDLINSDKASQKISDEADQSKQDYALSSGTASSISDTISTYKDINDFNVEKLNNMVYTYFFMQKAGVVGSQNAASIGIQGLTQTINFPTGIMGVLGGFKKDKQAVADAANKIVANQKLSTVGRTLQKNIQTLIKQMSANNLKIQQLTTAQQQIKYSKTANISSVLISNIVKNTLTAKDLENTNLDYAYIEDYQDTKNMDPESTIFMVPTKTEMESPDTKNNLLNIRIRSYKLAKSLKISSLGDYTPNIPKNFKYFIDKNLSQNYKESDFCTKIGNNICGSAIGVTSSSNPLIGEMEDMCKDIPTSINNYCASNNANSASCSDKVQLTSDITDMCKTMGY